ncbi:MAG: hypothetical protein ACE5GT_15140 [Rhodospirillales bacterium]
MPMNAGDEAAKSGAPSGSQGVRPAAATAGGETIPAPGPNERVEAAIESGQTVRLEVPRLHNVRFAVRDDALLIVLPDGGEIFLANFVSAAAGDLFTALSLADGTVVLAADLISLAGTSLADVIPRAHLAEDAPAVAGPAAFHGDGADATELDIPSPGPPEAPPLASRPHENSPQPPEREPEAKSVITGAAPPTKTPAAAWNGKFLRRLHSPLQKERGTMKNGNGSMNGIKCYLSRDEMAKIIGDEVARRLEPERLLDEYTKETNLFDDGRVEIIFSTSGRVYADG